MLSVDDLHLIDNLLERHRQPAILLHLPYPPHSVPTGRSKIGGKPNLPMDHEWPVGKSYGTAVPLHFFAQIDCAELPVIDERLPRSGVLFFFGCDLDHAWGDTAPHNDARVIFVQHLPADTPLREPPANLPAIREQGAQPGKITARGGLPGQSGPNLHIEWPLIARKIES